MQDDNPNLNEGQDPAQDQHQDQDSYSCCILRSCALLVCGAGSCVVSGACGAAMYPGIIWFGAELLRITGNMSGHLPGLTAFYQSYALGSALVEVSRPFIEGCFSDTNERPVPDPNGRCLLCMYNGCAFTLDISTNSNIRSLIHVGLVASVPVVSSFLVPSTAISGGVAQAAVAGATGCTGVMLILITPALLVATCFRVNEGIMAFLSGLAIGEADNESVIELNAIELNADEAPAPDEAPVAQVIHRNVFTEHNGIQDVDEDGSLGQGQVPSLGCQI